MKNLLKNDFIKKTGLKKCLLCSVFALFANCLPAQQATVEKISITLTVTDINDNLAAKKINTNTSALLTELSRAFFENRTPSLNKITGLNRMAQKSILSIWEMMPFRCAETEITEHGYKKSSGWQVRNIPIILKNMPEKEATKEIAVNFDETGAVEDVYFTVDSQNYKAIMESEGNEETGLRRREAILDFTENLLNAYLRKDNDLIAKVFSDDALIVAGKIVKQIKSDNTAPYTKDKHEYIRRIQNIFKSTEVINAVFENVTVTKHQKHGDIYGVRLEHTWNTANYSDAGNLFLLIDFSDSEYMKIIQTVWQSKSETFKLEQ